jgi:hypothetical protein
MADVSTATKTKTSTLSRVGTVLTIVSLVALAVPLLYLLYAAINGNVTLNSSDAVTNLFTYAIILTAAAGVLGLVAAVIHGTGLRRGFTTGTGAQVGASVVLLIAAAIFLFTTLLPRASAVQHLNDKIAPFALNLQANCQKPLDQVQHDIAVATYDAHVAFDGAQGPAGVPPADPTYITNMGNDITNMQKDESALKTALSKLNRLAVPDPKYQALLNGCAKDVQSEITLLTDSNAIQLPAQAVAVIHISSLSLLTLLQDSVQVINGSLPVSIPHPLVYQLVSGVLDAIEAQSSDPQLTAEGDQLAADINDTLKKNLAPFVPGPALTA